MTTSEIPECDVIPSGRGVHVVCQYPAPHCSIANMKNMCGINYKETVSDSCERKTIVIEPWKCCDYYMAQGLCFVATNICRACRMQEQQTSR